jgi:hypothetical protein
VDIPHQDPGDLEATPGTPLDVAAVILEQPQRGRADDPAAQEADDDVYSHRPITISSSYP